MEAEGDGGVISANGKAEDNKIRIYVGGLGGSVTEFDLKKTFSSTQMGLVDSVEVVRSKDRSFAYLDFVPISDKGLSTLFSKYNGCTWKGGKLRLEKAKEHYSMRLRREWAEDTARNSEEVHNGNDNEERSTPKKMLKASDMEDMYLQLFFPRLKKIKQIPFKGTGKHKYSFQNIVVPAFPSHFCDCEEHSSSSSKLACQEASLSTYADNKEGVVGGINKEELDTMNSVLSKILARECNKADVSMAEDPHAGEDDDDGDLVMNLVAASGNDAHVTDTGEDGGSDEDDGLIINVVAGGNNKKSFSDIGDKYANTTAVNKGFQASESNGPSSNKKKRKAPPLRENGDGNSLSDKLKILPHPPHGKLHSEDHDAERPTKIPWRHLKSDNATFHISDIAENNNSPGKPVKNKNVKSSKEKEEEQIQESGGDVDLSHNPEVVAAAENKNVERNSWVHLQSDNATFRISDIAENNISLGADLQGESDKNKNIKSSKVKEVEEEQIQKIGGDGGGEVVPGGNPEVVVVEAENKNMKRNSWIQKSSWMQLLGEEPSNSSFCISQVLSGSGLNMENQDQEQVPQMKNFNESSTVNDEDEHQKSTKKGDNSNLQEEDVNVSLGGHTQTTIVKPSLQDVVTPTTALAANKRNQQKLQQVDPCSFVRSAASMKEWKKAKQALSRTGRKSS